MKNLIKLIGIIALTALIGFSLLTCSSGGGGGSGPGGGGLYQGIMFAVDATTFEDLWPAAYAARDDVDASIAVGLAIPTRAAAEKLVGDLMEASDAKFGEDGVFMGTDEPITLEEVVEGIGEATGDFFSSTQIGKITDSLKAKGYVVFSIEIPDVDGTEGFAGDFMVFAAGEI